MKSEKWSDRRGQRVSVFMDRNILIYALLSSFVTGIVCHGMAIFNKISFHDDWLTVTSAGITSGRWAGEFLDDHLAPIWREFLSTPVLLGFTGLLFLGLSVYYIALLFEIKDALSVVIISGLMISFPSITSCFGYIFQIHTYCLSIFLAVFGSYIICRTKKYYYSLFSCVLLSFAVGIYQSAISIVLVIFLCYMIFELFEGRLNNAGEIARNILYYGINSICFLGMYIGIEYSYLKTHNLVLSSYQGIQSMGQGNIVTYFRRIATAVLFFFNPGKTGDDVYPFGVRVLYFIVITAVICILGGMTVNDVKTGKSKVKILSEVVLCCCLPVSIDFIYVMCDHTVTFLHAITLYSQVTPFVMLCVLLSKSDKCELFKTKTAVMRMIRKAGIFVCFMVVVLYARYGNLCYTKAVIMQEQAKSYFTALVTRITSTDGYMDGMGVVYINDRGKVNSNEPVLTGFSDVKIVPYGMNSLINDYSWREFAAIWCGFSPVEFPADSVPSEQYINMPHYPSEGSIKIYDGKVIINF